MILSSHLCLLTDGSLGRFPVARLGEGSVVEGLELRPDGPEETGGMVFRGGVMVCGLPAGVTSVACSGREDFARRLAGYGVAVGRGPVAVLTGCDLGSFAGVFRVWRPESLTINTKI